MKRITAILLSVMMIACLAISCDNNAASDAKAETVSISFAEARSRSLTASIAEFDASKYYWGYAARKTDSTGLKAGETAFRWVKTGDDDPEINDTGIANVTIPGFSQGAWEFTLYAYTANSRDSLAYTGMTNTVLEKGNTNAIAVTVSPVSEGDGTLFVDISRITIKPAREGSALSSAQQDSFVKEVSVARMPSGEIIEAIEPGEGIEKYTYSTEPGAYKVSVALRQNGILYASGSVVATVYSNLTTTVKGDLLEQVTSATFNPSVNPDVMNLIASSSSVDIGVEGDTTGNIVLTSGVTADNPNAKVTATVAKSSAKNYIEALKAADDTSSYVKNAANYKITLNLSVDTTSAATNSVEYEISMSSTIVSKDENNEVTATEVYPVKNLNEYVKVVIRMQSNVANIKVKHGNAFMTPVDDIDDFDPATDDSNNAGVFHYNAGEGILTLKTKTFSPFTVTYSEFVAEMNGRRFASLQDAINNAPSDGSAVTVKLLDDIYLDSTVESDIDFTLDLNGKNIEADSCRALWIKKGSVSINGSGTISSVGQNTSSFSTGSSVIRVGSGSDWSKQSGFDTAELVIGSSVTVKSGLCYAVSVFGDTKEKITVEGKIEGLSGLGTSGNEKYPVHAPEVVIASGAKVKATGTDDYALYLPAAGVYDISGTIEGDGGICTKAGNLNVAITESAVIKANGAPGMAYENGYSNGPATKNYAVVVENNSAYGGPAVVVISGGEITGELGVYDDASHAPAENQKGTITVTGGSFSKDPTDFVAAGYNVVHSGSKWNVLDFSKVFAGGTGTEEDPILLSTSDHLKNIYKSGAYNGYHYKLDNDIVVTSYYSVSGWQAVIPFFYNGSIDGDGHRLIVNDGDDNTFISVFYSIQNSEIKNLEVDVDYSMVIYAQGNTVSFDNVDLSGEFTVSGNEGAYVIYGFIGEKLSFKNCTSSVEMTGTSYNAVFVGYVNWSADKCNTLEFINCENNGTLVCSYASMFIGNPNAYQIKCVVENCTNSGTIQATATDKVFNYYYAVPSNCYNKFVINGVEYKDIADGHSSAPSCFEDTTVSNTGHVIQGPQNTGMAITQNADGTFTIADAVIDGKTVDHYTVYVGVYAALKEGGSSRNYVTETISASSETRVTALKNLKFVDTQWVEAHTDAVRGELAGNVIYTLAGESYYMLVTPNTDTLNGMPKAPQMIYVVAYDSNNTTLASTKLLGSIE